MWRAIVLKGSKFAAGRWAMAVDGATAIVVQGEAASQAGFSTAHAGQKRRDGGSQFAGDKAVGLAIEFAVMEGKSVVVTAHATAEAGIVLLSHVVEDTAIGLGLGNLDFAPGMPTAPVGRKASFPGPAALLIERFCRSRSARTPNGCGSTRSFPIQRHRRRSALRH